MNKIILLIIASINLTSSANTQFRKYVFCGYDIWIRKHDKNQQNVLEILQTVSPHGLVNIDDESSESFESSSSSSFDSHDSLHSNHSEEEIEEMASLYSPHIYSAETLNLESLTSFKKDLTEWSFQTGSTLSHSPQSPPLQRLARKITKKDLITSNNSKLYLGDSIMSDDYYRSSDLSPSDRSLFSLKSPTLSLQKQLISLKTINNGLQNDIKRLEEEIEVSELNVVHCSKQLQITRRIVQEQQLSLTKMGNEADRKIKEIANIHDYYKESQEELINEIEELQNKVYKNEKDELHQINLHSIPRLINNSNNITTEQNLDASSLGESADYRYQSLKTLNNAPQNDINHKTIEIKGLEEEIVHCSKQLKITEMMKEIANIHNYYKEYQEELMNEIEELQNNVYNEINNKTTTSKQMEEDHLNELKVKRLILKELENNMKRIQKLINHNEKLENDQQQLISNIAKQRNEIEEKSKEIVVCELKLVHCLDELNGTKLIIDEQQMNITKMKNDDDEKTWRI